MLSSLQLDEVRVDARLCPIAVLLPSRCVPLSLQCCLSRHRATPACHVSNCEDYEGGGCAWREEGGCARRQRLGGRERVRGVLCWPHQRRGCGAAGHAWAQRIGREAQVQSAASRRAGTAKCRRPMPMPTFNSTFSYPSDSSSLLCLASSGVPVRVSRVVTSTRRAVLRPCAPLSPTVPVARPTALTPPFSRVSQ